MTFLSILLFILNNRKHMYESWYYNRKNLRFCLSKASRRFSNTANIIFTYQRFRNQSLFLKNVCFFISYFSHIVLFLFNHFIASSTFFLTPTPSLYAAAEFFIASTSPLFAAFKNTYLPLNNLLSRLFHNSTYFQPFPIAPASPQAANLNSLKMLSLYSFSHLFHPHNNMRHYMLNVHLPLTFLF